MTNEQDRSAPSNVKAINGLRTNSFAALVMLLLEFGLGVGVNLYATLPAADHGRSLLPAFGRAVTGGPLVLAVHAVLGTILLVTGVSALLRASLIRQSILVVITGCSLLGIIVAWLSGARFVGSQADAASMTMTVASCISMLGYVLVLFIAHVPSREEGMQ